MRAKFLTWAILLWITLSATIRPHTYLLKPKHRRKVDESYVREVWNYKNANFDELNKKIRNFNWDDIINDTFSADEACNNFTAETYVNLCKSCIPRKKVVIRPSD